MHQLFSGGAASVNEDEDIISVSSLSLSRQENDIVALSPSPVHRRRYLNISGGLQNPLRPPLTPPVQAQQRMVLTR
jgi:hypothetical protein